MWIPKTEEDIHQAIANGLEESATFDAKRELGTKNKEIAKDIAAMANDGGVLLYGLDEDEHGRPTILAPFPLEGMPEKINNIVQTGIQEPPEIVIKRIDSSNPGEGYIVVIVPPSPRAPHLVILGKDSRFYGRTATGAIPLNEGDIARLYMRRQQTEQTQGHLLETLVSYFPRHPESKGVHLYLGVWPVLPMNDIMTRIHFHPDEGSERSFFYHQVAQANTEAANLLQSRNEGRINFRKEPEARTTGWRLNLGRDEDKQPDKSALSQHTIHLRRDGSLFMFYDNLTMLRSIDSEPVELISESWIIELTTFFVCLLNQIYTRSSYLGTIDIGIYLDGLTGTNSSFLFEERFIRSLPVKDSSYERVDRISAMSLTHDTVLNSVDNLLAGFLTVTTQGYVRHIPALETRRKE